MRVGLPACPFTVKVGLFNQNPPVAPMVYPAEVNTAPLNVLLPETFNVPFVKVTNPIAEVLNPLMEKCDRFISKIEADEVPLLMVSVFKSVVTPVPE